MESPSIDRAVASLKRILPDIRGTLLGRSGWFAVDAAALLERIGERVVPLPRMSMGTFPVKISFLFVTLVVSKSYSEKIFSLISLAFGQGEPPERVKLFRMIRVNSFLCPTVYILGIPMVEPQSQPDQTQGYRLIAHPAFPPAVGFSHAHACGN